MRRLLITVVMIVAGLIPRIGFAWETLLPTGDGFWRTGFGPQGCEENGSIWSAVWREGRLVCGGFFSVAVHASCAIPGVFVPVRIGERTLVDGGVTDPIPCDIARELGADVVIALAIPAPIPQEVPKSPLDVALHSVSIMSVEIARLRAGEADVVIWPEVGNIRYDDFSQKKTLIESGERAARAALPEIRRAIAARTRWESAAPTP